MELIYVIEDDENIRELIQAALSSYGYQVTAFEAAEPALENIAKDRPALAIFDLMLPGMDGLQAIEEIRKNPQAGCRGCSGCGGNCPGSREKDYCDMKNPGK